MKNKKIIFTIVIAIVFIAILLVIVTNKISFLNEYKSKEKEINVDNIFNETLTVVNYEESEVDETIYYEGLTLKNYFKEYVPMETNPSTKVKYNSDGEIEAWYRFYKWDEYVINLNLEFYKAYYNGDEKARDMDTSTDEDTKKFLKDNKIENDVDLLRYIKNNYYLKNNIFMSKQTIKNNYLINTFVDFNVDADDDINVILIDGRLMGYIENHGFSKDIRILKDGVVYGIALYGSTITNNEFIMDLLETVSF